MKSRRSEAAGTRAAEAAACWARTTESAASTTGTWAAVSAAGRTWTAATAVFTGARFADRQRAAIEHLAIEFLNRLFRMPSILELDECESPRTSSFAIDRQHDLRRRSDGAEVAPEISFGGGVRQITHEQTDSQSKLLVKAVKYPEWMSDEGRRESSRSATRWQPVLG